MNAVPDVKRAILLTSVRGRRRNVDIIATTSGHTTSVVGVVKRRRWNNGGLL